MLLNLWQSDELSIENKTKIAQCQKSYQNQDK